MIKQKSDRRQWLKDIVALTSSMIFAKGDWLPFRPQDDISTVMTVQGPVDIMQIRRTLSDFIMLADRAGYARTNLARWNRDQIIAEVLPLFLRSGPKGFNCYIDTAPSTLGRDPWMMRDLSEKSGYHIITNTGLSCIHGSRYLPDWAIDIDSESLTYKWLREAEVGIDDSRVKIGIVRLGLDFVQYPDLSKKFVDAAMTVHQKMGVPLFFEGRNANSIKRALEITGTEGIPPQAITWLNIPFESDIEAVIELARTGVWVCFSRFAQYQTETWIDAMNQCKKAGVIDKVLIGVNQPYFLVGEPQVRKPTPLDLVMDRLLPALDKTKLSKKEKDMVWVDNPRYMMMKGRK